MRGYIARPQLPPRYESPTPSLDTVLRIVFQIWRDRERVAALRNLPPSPLRRTAQEWVEPLSRHGVDAESLVQAVVALEAYPHLKLVHRVANKAVRSSPEHTVEDLLGWGWDGLCRALSRYDPSQGTISTYAVQRIAGRIRDGIRDEHHLPKRLHSDMSKLTRKAEEFVDQYGRTPSELELAEFAGEAVEKIRYLVHFQNPKSLDEIRDLHPEAGDFEDDTADVESQALTQVESERLRSALDQLPEDEKNVIVAFYQEGLSSPRIAEQLDCSSSDVYRIRDRGLRTLRHLLAA